MNPKSTWYKALLLKQKQDHKMRLFTFIGLILVSIVSYAQQDSVYTSLADTANINFEEVTHVDFSNQKLSELPTELFLCTNLKELLLNNNKLESLPEGIQVFTKLEVFNLDNNNLETLPKEFKELIELKELYLNNAIKANQVNIIFGYFAQNKKLKILELGGNNINMLPNTIKSLKELKHFELRKNLLTSIPKNVAKMLKLQYIGLSSNPKLDFNGSFENMSHITTLRTIDISFNQLKAIPKEVMAARYISTLNISNNEITELPDQMTQLIRLKRLNAENNAIDKIAEAISLLERLQYWNMNNNKLTALPAGIGGMVELKVLEVHNNQLTSVPESLRHLIELEKLDFGGSEISKLGFNIGSLSALKYLDLGGAKLTDLKARGIVSLTKLEYLDLSGSPELNWEEVDEAIFNLTSLHTLKLEHNRIIAIPESIDRCVNLIQLDLSRNEHLVTDEIFWKYMAGLPHLTSLNLAETAIKVVDDHVKDCTKLEQLTLDNNPITSIPDAISNLKELKVLSLNQTKLNTIPESLSKLEFLEKVSLARCDSLDLKGLMHNIRVLKLKELDLSGGHIETFPEDIPYILVKIIILSGNAIEEIELKRLKEKLPYTKIVYE
jgi:Leucine-rich repeat (LRR) protein